MARSSTVLRAALSIADMDRHHYHDYEMTIAQHPSETDLRMMVRLAAFCFHADERLLFTKGLCVEDEPELWNKDYSDDIELWIDLGQPDEKRIRKACGRAKEVVIYAYQEKSARDWWKQQGSKLSRFKNLSVFLLDVEGIDALAQRSIRLQCNISDGELSLHDQHDHSVTIRAERWQ